MELKITNLTKQFQDLTAVNHISCILTNGVYGLLGVNGAGKTTLMRMLCTLLKPTEGQITWNGADIFEMDREYRRVLGYLPQDFGYYPEFSVEDYLLYIASIKGLRPATAKQRTRVLLERVGLMKVKSRKMKKLSGGMIRRAGIAQAMLNKPRILVMDEPSAGLDPNERIRFRNLISELAEERLVLLSTHIVSDVEYIANEILLMKRGQICLSGTTEELIRSMDEKVWTIRVKSKEAESWMKAYKVANVKTLHGTAEHRQGISELRLLSEQKPFPGAAEEEATLEDVFLHYFGEKAGEEDDEV